MPHPNISFRTVTPEDTAFLYELFVSNQQEVLVVLNAGKDQQDVLMQMQFSAQQRYYESFLPQANFDLVLLEKKPIGRLYLNKSEKEFHLIDIALLPLYQQKGIGGNLLRDVLTEASILKKTVRLNVVKTNPAINLYKRLGFYQTSETGIHYQMEYFDRKNN